MLPIRPLAAAALLVVAGCQTSSDASNLATIDLIVGFSAANMCSSVPPSFKVNGVPSETKALRFKMVDRNVPSYRHGGGTVAYVGQNLVPAGSFKYTGPCPPGGQRHIYQWTVEALDESGAVVLGRGTYSEKFPL